MRRLYYLASDIQTVEQISHRLHEEGVADWNIHVLARNTDGFYNHHIRSALLHHRKDFIRTGEIGALYGAVTLLVMALALVTLGSIDWLRGWQDVLMLTLLGSLIGCLNGIRLGKNRDNHRLESFQHDINHGRLLIMVDAHSSDKAKIRELMNMEFSHVEYRGNDSTFIRPFKSNDRIYPRPQSRPEELSDPVHRV